MEFIGLSISIYIAIIVICSVTGYAIGRIGQQRKFQLGSIAFGFFFFVGLSQIVGLLDVFSGISLFNYLPFLIVGLTIVALCFCIVKIKKPNKTQLVVLGFIFVLVAALFYYQGEYLNEFSLASYASVPKHLGTFNTIYSTANIHNAVINGFSSILDGYTIFISAIFFFINRFVSISYPVELFISVGQLLYLTVTLDLIAYLGFRYFEKFKSLPLLGLLISLYTLSQISSLKFGFDSYMWIIPLCGICADCTLSVIKSRHSGFHICLIVILTSLFGFGAEGTIVALLLLIVVVLLLEFDEVFQFKSIVILTLAFCGLGAVFYRQNLVIALLSFTFAFSCGMRYVLREVKYSKAVRIGIAIVLTLILVYCTSQTNNVEWSYLLNKPSSELRLDYLVPSQYAWIVPLLLVILTLVMLFSSISNSSKVYGLMVILLALTPLAWGLFEQSGCIRYAALFVLFNPFSLIVFDWLLQKGFRLPVSRHNAFGISVGLLVVFCSVTSMLVNPYYDDYKPDLLKNARISGSEYEVYSWLNADRDDISEIKIIAQSPFAQVYVPNSHLLYSWPDRMDTCQYCDVEAENLHQPDDLTNIFMWRDYADNRLYIESPKYEQSCPLLIANEYDYLILDKSRTKQVNGNYMPLYLGMDSCTSVVNENEQYILLKVGNGNNGIQ